MFNDRGEDDEAAHGSNTDFLGHPLEAVRRAGVPKEEEWKMTAECKNSSSSLGKLETTGSMQSVTSGIERMSVRRADNMSYMSRKGHASAYHNLNASKAPIAQSTHHHPPSHIKMEDNRCWELCRYYDDFYDFQIALLTQFEEEAGQAPNPAILARS
ncbi:hypothetical protein BDW60DRAFT_212689 [Aspergillus nidulans var. acristatus]